jgi:hypothetical protein
MMEMHGPDIVVRTISVPTPKGEKLWQYHSRSDHHSKVACWAILFDLLNHSALLRDHVGNGRIGFGVNHEMRDFRTRRKKKLDLVLSTPRAEQPKRRPATIGSLATKWNIQLTDAEKKILSTFPVLAETPVGNVHVALEAKAAMTEHGKAESRLYDELNSSHDAVHGAAEMAIAAGFVMVNMGVEFISPGRGTYENPVVSKHDQPRVTASLIAKVLEIPRRSTTSAAGFDALGIVVVQAKNDKSPVRLVTEPPAPAPGDPVHYDSMIGRIIQLYEARFPHA